MKKSFASLFIGMLVSISVQAQTNVVVNAAGAIAPTVETIVSPSPFRVSNSYFKNLFFKNALPEPDLKYSSNFLACPSVSTATYDFNLIGRKILVEVTSPF